MPAIKSRIDTRSEDFRSNAAFLQQQVDDLRVKAAQIALGGDAKSRERHAARGKLLPRDRVNGLLDPGTPFLEIGQLAAWGMYDGEAPAAGMIAGIGRVHGQEVMIVANDATVKGGTYYPMTVKKHLRAQEIAMQNRLPCIYLVDSGGAFLPRQDDVFPDREHFGRIFFNQANMSAQGIAQIAVVMGSCTAGGAYVPAMSDETIIVKNQGTIFLGGPPLVKAAIGEIVSAEELGGGDVHTRLSGVADHLADDDRHALAIARRIIASLNRTKPETVRLEVSEEPLYDPKEIYGVIPRDTKKPYDVREVIARVVDGSYFEEFKALYGPTLVCGWGSVHGYPVGIIGNNGALFSESAEKAAQFIQLCNQIDTPIVFLHNITGYIVGADFEQGGITKNGSKMINAVSNSTVPHISIIVGASYGAGNYGMSGRAFGTRFTYIWPTAKIAVMGPKQMAGVMSIVGRAAAQRRGAVFDEAADAKRAAIAEHWAEERSKGLYATSRISDDGMIDPRDTRAVIAMSLSACANNKVQGTKEFGTWRM